MLDIFIRLKTLVKLSHIHIDSSVFRLHWCISSVILLTFSVIVTTRQYVGNPIDCIHTNDVPDDVFDLYCWIHSTYTIPRALSLQIGEEVAHPGVLKSSPGPVSFFMAKIIKRNQLGGRGGSLPKYFGT